MTSMQAPTGTSKSAKFQTVNPLGPLANPFAGLVSPRNGFLKRHETIDIMLPGSTNETMVLLLLVLLLLLLLCIHT